MIFKSNFESWMRLADFAISLRGAKAPRKVSAFTSEARARLDGFKAQL
jgi:hypothetical protein